MKKRSEDNKMETVPFPLPLTWYKLAKESCWSRIEDIPEEVRRTLSKSTISSWKLAQDAQEPLRRIDKLIRENIIKDNQKSQLCNELNKLKEITARQTSYCHDIAISLYEQIRFSHAQFSELNNVFLDYVGKYGDPFSLIPITFLHAEGLYDLTETNIYNIQSFYKPSTSKDTFPYLLYERSQLDKYHVLLVGETGTSKGSVTKALWRMGTRRNKELVDINVAAIPDYLLESVLFGYRKGAFTGADKNKKGLLEVANGGTLVLDELGKMPRHLQVKILKVLEDNKFYPVGSDETISLDVHFIATAQPSELENIYPDLVWRIGKPDIIELSPLRKRLKTAPEAVLFCSLLRAREKLGLPDLEIDISASARSVLLKREYPGNYRELENILAYAIRSARRRGGMEILEKDLKIAGSHREENFFKKSVEEVEHKIADISLKDIISHADDAKISIIETKLKDVLRSGNSIKQILINDGLSENEYQLFMKRIKNITGKGISELKKDVKINSHIQE